MSRKLLASIIILLLLITGAGAYVLYDRKDTPPTTLTTEAMNDTETTKDTTETTDTPAQQPGTYVDYSSSAVASAKGTKLLFFHASWCPQCRALDKSIREQTLPNNLTIFKVDYDSNQTLRQQYGVTIQTTVVKIDDQGNAVKSYVAYEEPHFAAVKQALLP